MKRIGVITDAHANYPALLAALNALDHADCDVIVHTGDAVGIGPHPAEVLQTLLDRPNLHLLMGNHDAYFAFGLSDHITAWMDDEEVAHQRWTHAQLSPDLRSWVATWPYALNLVVHGVKLSFCHYPREPDGSGFVPIIRNPRPHDLDHLFEPSSADLIFYGHHHPASDLQGRARYINPGALGCSYLPEARYAILEIQDDGEWQVTTHAVPYDIDQVFRDFEHRQVPARAMILRALFGQSAAAEN